MKKIAIKPHKTRAIELIEILERMGGYNSHHLDGFSFRDDTAYLIDEDGIITSYTEHLCHEKGYKIYTLEEWEDEYKSDEMIEGLVEEETKLDIDKVMEEHQKIVDEIFEIQGIEPIEAEEEHIVHCPEGYQFVDENGNIINATKIVLEKKKKEYPKTYEECCKVLDVCSGETLQYGDLTLSNDYEFNLYMLLENFRKLRIARDAYWKIAGDEMGLGKPWKPDYRYKDTWYSIYYNGFSIIQANTFEAHTFIFPTEEMRDAFYENFKELIEQCKELL